MINEYLIEQKPCQIMVQTSCFAYIPASNACEFPTSTGFSLSCLPLMYLVAGGWCHIIFLITYNSEYLSMQLLSTNTFYMMMCLFSFLSMFSWTIAFFFYFCVNSLYSENKLNMSLGWSIMFMCYGYRDIDLWVFSFYLRLLFWLLSYLKTESL